jgi:exodeoxyribonuclease V alpha subunit
MSRDIFRSREFVSRDRSEIQETLNVVVERVLYPPETTEGANWFIIATSDHGVCKSTMGWRPRTGERLKLSGKYSAYQGKREFKFVEAELDIPTDSRGMLHYVCEMASGVGSTMEEAIWQKRGEDWAQIEEFEVPRLQGRVYQAFVESIERAESDRAKGAAIAQLLAAGCTMNMASAAYETWKESTLGVVSSNPYRLAELPGYGFSHVDTSVRLHYGITDGDPRRIKAAIIYVLRQMTQSGSTLVPWQKLNSECLAKLGGYGQMIRDCVGEMFQEGTLKGFKSSRSLALASDHKNESMIWDYIKGKKEGTDHAA